MTAASDHRDNKYSPGLTEEYPCDGAAQTIYHGAMVCVDTTGYAMEVADTAGYEFVGVCKEKVEITGTETDGTSMVKVQRDGVHRFVCAGFAITDVGKPVWATDDQTVQLTPSNVFVGTVAKYISATAVDVEIEPGTKIGSRRKIISIPLKDIVVCAATYKIFAYAANRSCRVWACKFANVVAGSSNGTIAIDNRDGVTTARNLLGAATYSISAITALTCVDLTLSSTAANLLMDEGDFINVVLVAGSACTTANEGVGITLEIEEYGLANAA